LMLVIGREDFTNTGLGAIIISIKPFYYSTLALGCF